MEFSTKKEGEILIVKPEISNIDASICTEFKSKFIDLINKNHPYILLNLDKVEFIDSMGLGAIISVFKTLELNKGSLGFSDVKPTIMNLFKITRLDLVFKIYPTEKDGLENLMKSKK